MAEFAHKAFTDLGSEYSIKDESETKRLGFHYNFSECLMSDI